MSRSWSFELPKSDAPVSSNVRGQHWSLVSKEHHTIRWDAKMLTLSLAIPRRSVQAIDLLVTIVPPDRRRRDEDNYVAHLVKPIKDGIVEALRLEDDTSEYVTWQVRIASPDGSRRWRYVVEFTSRPRREEGDAEAAAGLGHDRVSRRR